MARKRSKQKIPQGEIALHFAYYSKLLRDWYDERSGVLACAARFLGYFVALYLLSLTSFYQRVLTDTALIDAQMANAMLHLLGEKSHYAGPGLFLDRDCIVTVAPLCTALDFSWFLIAAILAFPASWPRRILGVVVGVIISLLLNVVRVASLYVVGVHYTAFLTIVHEQIWGVLLNLAMAAILVTWIAWINSGNRRQRHVAA